MESGSEDRGLRGPSERKKDPRVFNKGDTLLDPSAKLLRFLHVGNDKNVLVCQRSHDISIDDLDNRLGFIKEMVAVDIHSPFTLIRNAVLGNKLRRNDEALLAVVYCLRCVDNIAPERIVEMKVEIYQGVPEILRTDADLFLFVFLYKKVSQTNFGRGMKKALGLWYHMRTAEELAEIFGRNRGMYGW